ncbi:MAG: hypothetical protein PHI58_00120, partial [Candidatus Omnitrophica bacterium]|nr:hypothetical protein [Candidatus Omnitrophota bacterium]
DSDNVGGGAITDNTALENPNIVADTATLIAGTGIGALGAADINVDVNTMSATNNLVNDIYINELNSAYFNSIISNTGSINLLSHASSLYKTITAANDVIIEIATGDMTIVAGGKITATTGGVTITIGNGSIFVQDTGTHIKAGADSAIYLAGGTITVIGDALNVDITGVLTLDIPDAGSSGGFNAKIVGTVTGMGGPLVVGAGWPLLINTSTAPLQPSTKVSFNGTIIWPPTVFSDYDFLIQELMKRDKDILEFLNNFRLVNMNPNRPFFYFYHPLTPVDQAAFDNINLDIGAYEFIDNFLEFKKRPASFYGA